MEHELTWVAFLSLAADFAMIIVTIVYVVFTWRLVKITKQSFQCQLVPLIGIEIQKIVVGPLFGPKRRQMSVALCVLFVPDCLFRNCIFLYSYYYFMIFNDKRKFDNPATV